MEVEKEGAKENREEKRNAMITKGKDCEKGQKKEKRSRK